MISRAQELQDPDKQKTAGTGSFSYSDAFIYKKNFVFINSVIHLACPTTPRSHIDMKEKPRQSPREPPNSAIKEVSKQTSENINFLWIRT